MNLQESIRRILREEYIPTETEYLGWDIPRKLYDKLEDIGIKIWDKENDKVYIAEFQFNTNSVVFEILDSTGESYFNSLFPIPLSYKSYHTKKIKDLPISIKYFIRRRFEQEWVNIMDKYDDDGKIIQENIRRILREEVFESDESRQERKFTKLLNNIQEYLNSNSYDSVVRFMVDYDEVMDDVIVNIFFDAEHAVKLGGGINSVIKRTGKKIMEDLSVFPFDFKYHIHFDKPQLNESKTSQHLKIINNLLEPLKEKDCLCDIRISFDVEENYYDIYLVFSQKELHEKFSDLYGIRSYIQKMMNEVKMELESFLPIRNIFIGNYTTPNCEWSPLNESEDDKEKKIQKNLTVLRKLISMFEYSEVCDMWVDYHYEDDDYIIRSKMSTKNHNTAALEKEFEFLEDSIKSLGFTNCYVFRPYYVENCEGENELNESEDDKEKKIQKNLRAIRQLLDTIDVDGLCEMWVEYNPEDGDYEIRSKTTVRYYDMADMAQELGYIEDTIRSWKLKTYVFSPYYVENCEDEIEYLNESENKKSSLLRAIEEDGLYEVITSTSLHIHEIEQKVGQLSREVLERFIIDVVKEHHSDIDEDGQTYYIYLKDYPFNEVPVGNNDYVEQLKVTKNELFFVVSHFEEDKYGELEFSSKELIPSNNLEYYNIYEIAGQMGFFLSKGLI